MTSKDFSSDIAFLRQEIEDGATVPVAVILKLHEDLLACGQVIPLDLEEHALSQIFSDNAQRSEGSAERLARVMAEQHKHLPRDLVEYLQEKGIGTEQFLSPNSPAVVSFVNDYTLAEVEFARESRSSESTVAAMAGMPSTTPPLTHSWVAGYATDLAEYALEAYFNQVRLDEARSALRKAEENPEKKLNSKNLFLALVAEACSRGVPIEITAQVLKHASAPDDGRIYSHLKDLCFRRAVHWQDVGALVAIVTRYRCGDARFAELDQRMQNCADELRKNGTSSLGQLLSAEQVAEIQTYFLRRPAYNGHTAEDRLDNIQRYVDHGAEQYSFASYSLADTVEAPHILELAVDPKILEVGRQHLGCMPALSKIFVHWDFPNTDHLVGDVTIGEYHRDLNDFGMYWVYIYLTDVDMESGPHASIPESHHFDFVSEKLQDAKSKGVDLRHLDRELTVFDFFDGYGYQLDDKIKQEIFGDDEIFFTGPAGMGFASNGIQLHKIHQPQSKRRLIVALRYQASAWPRTSPARECDSVPSFILGERIPDDPVHRVVLSPMVKWDRDTSRDVAQKRYDYIPGGAFRLDTPRRQKAFLSVGNGRTGSTWLMSTLGQLPGVNTDYEYRWCLPEGAEPDELHRMVRELGGTVRDDFQSWSADAAVGSKLIFSLEAYDFQDAIDGLSAKIDDEVSAFLLSRHYADVLLSFRYRGPTHRVDPNDSRLSRKANVLLRRTQEYFLQHGEAKANYPFRPRQDLLGDLYQLAMNDVVGYAITQNKAKSLFINYAEIREKFPALMDFLGISASDKQIEDVLADPITQKLPAIDEDIIPDFAEIRQIADDLWQNLLTAVDRGLSWQQLRDQQISLLRKAGLP